MRNLLLSGGVGHPFPATSGALAELLDEVGITSEITEDIEDGLRALADYDLLTVNALRWRMDAERYAHLRDDWAFSLSAEGRAEIERHLAHGRPILAIHTACICFDDWAGWGAIVGGAWDWGRSSHPPISEARINVRTDAHAVVAGIGDFSLVDEVYGFLALQDDVAPLATSPHGGADHALLWVRHVAGARVAFDALGHDERSYASPEHRRLIRRLGRRFAGAGDAEIAEQE
jgi:uncharacterized protein